MSAILIISAGMFLLSVAGMRHATSGNYPADASPVGSMILVASMVGIGVAFILFGIVLGMMIGARS